MQSNAIETLTPNPLNPLTPPLQLLSWRGDFPPSRADSACASCHAKMIPLTAAFVPGDDFFDHYDLVCLEDPDFSPDGRDLGENYTYTHWLLNPCARSSKVREFESSKVLDCTYCHTSSGRFRFADNPNAACTSCHKKDIATHSRHSKKTLELQNFRTLELPTCLSCHMPQTTFAAMRRSDHSHRPPCPEASRRFGGPPSACTLCHTAKDEAWAAAHVREWFPDNTRRAKILREGALVEAARKRDITWLGQVYSYPLAVHPDPVVATSILRLLRGIPSDVMMSVNPADPLIIGEVAAQCAVLGDHPLVRSAAAALLADYLNKPRSVEALLYALKDPSRVVRIQAAQSLAAYPRNRLDRESRKNLEAAEKELMVMFSARPDDWASHYNLGNYRLARGDRGGAMAAYKESMALRDDTVMPHVNAAVLASQNGNLNEAIGYLHTAHKASPHHGAVNLNLGLALAESGDPVAAERHLRIAMGDPACRAQAAYNCAVIVGQGNPNAAAELCREAVTSDPANPRYREALDYYQGKR